MKIQISASKKIESSLKMVDIFFFQLQFGVMFSFVQAHSKDTLLVNCKQPAFLLATSIETYNNQWKK